MHTKKVASVSLLIIGLLIVILGVIIGIMLQNAAEENNEELVCVNSKESPGYERWVSVLLYFSDDLLKVLTLRTRTSFLFMQFFCLNRVFLLCVLN